MGSNRTNPAPIRVRRAWIRVGLAVGVSAAIGALASSVLLDAEPPALPTTAASRVVVSTPPSAPTGVSEPAPRTPDALDPPPRPAPRSAGEVLDQDAALTSSQLARWVSDEQVAPTARYGALRRLEQEDPPAAVGAALEVLDDVTPLVRLNAIAVLTRADDPRAAEALARLDERSRRLATALGRTDAAPEAR